MPARQVEFERGGIYHLYNRGNNRKQIFPDREHYASCERLMQRYARQYQMRILAYVLMPNHYHVLVQQMGEVPVSRWVYSVFQAYARHLNQLEHYSGSLFEGRYHCKPITGTSYLIRSLVYIHGNPVKDGLVDQPEAWPYSNLLEWVGTHPSAACRKLFGSGEKYREVLTAYLQTKTSRPAKGDG